MSDAARRPPTAGTNRASPSRRSGGTVWGRAARVVVLLAALHPVSPLHAAAGQEGNEIVELPRPPGGSTGRGAISPAARRYAYEVGHPGGSTQIWSLDLGTGASRPLTRGPGAHRSPAWAPGGDRIAFWHRGGDASPELEGIWVVDLEAGRERRVFRPEDELISVRSPRWAGPDSILFDYRNANLVLGGDETWIVGADGGGARRVEDPARLARRPEDERLPARFAGCCNVWRDGLWVGPPDGQGGGERCLVGPVGHGRDLAPSRGGAWILFTTRLERGEEPTLWSVEVSEGDGRLVAAPDGRVLRSGGFRGIDGSATGVVAVRLEVARDSTVLWLIDDPASLTLSPPLVSGCRDRFPEVAAFAREQGLEGKLRIRPALRVPAHDFEVVRVTGVSADSGLQMREAVRAAGRVGWSGPPCRTGRFGDRSCRREVPEEGTYRPPDDADHLWSAAFLELLREEGWERRWVEVLLRAPGLPSAALDALMEHERFDDLLVEDDRVRGDADRLARIWERRRPSDPIARAAFDALWERGPEVVADPDLPRELLLHVARQAVRRASGDGPSGAVGRRLLELPGPARDPELLATLATLPPSADPEVYRIAGRRLIDHPSAPDGAVQRAAPNLAADPALAYRLFRDERILEDAGALRGLARTPWRNWSVAGRARRELRELRERRMERLRERHGIEGRIHLPRAATPSGPGVTKFRSGPGGDPRLAVPLLLPRIDPVTPPVLPDSAFMARRRATEGELCRLAAGPAAEEIDLERFAEGAVYATSTRLASCLLASPAGRDDPDVLEALASMVDVNRDPRLPGPEAPTIREIRRRASTMLRRLEGE